MAWKLTRKSSGVDEERIKSLEDQLQGTVERLDAALAESKRLSRQIDELARRESMRAPREVPGRRRRTKVAADLHTYDPDDTVAYDPDDTVRFAPSAR